MDVRKKTAEVHRFYYTRGEELLKLLSTIEDAAKQIKEELGPDCVRSVYSRGLKQARLGHGNEQFKAAGKVARLVLNNEQFKTPADVNDLMGLTIVVYYEDQIEPVKQRLTDKLQDLRILSKTTVEKKGGYYATHLNFVSSNPAHWELPCEVQIKTMLHDAWAWKTHDLTYKPRGQLDGRLGRMMNVFSDGLQAMELQSLMLRDFIQDRWRVEDMWRSAVRKGLLEVLPQWSNWDRCGEKARDLRKRIDDNKEAVIAAADDTALIREIRVGILQVCKESIFEGYLLEARFAILRDREADRERAIERAWECFEGIPREFCASKESSFKVWGIPLVLQACGDTESAIAIGHRLRETDFEFDERDRSMVGFNLANHLIEAAYVAGPLDPTDSQSRLEVVKALLKEAQLLVTVDESAMKDAEGMCDVVFATDSKTIRKGIESIELGKKAERKQEETFAATYYEHNARIAWQRLREAEAAEIRGRITA